MAAWVSAGRYCQKIEWKSDRGDAGLGRGAGQRPVRGVGGLDMTPAASAMSTAASKRSMRSVWSGQR